MIKMIWCQDSVGGIGLNNKLPWSIKSEMQHFVKSTKGHAVVMGRSTFESIGKPLPGRDNYIVTRNKNYHVQGATTINDWKEIINLANNKTIFIIGGKSIYELFLPYSDELIISKLNKNYNCDTYINIDLNNFKLESKENYPEFIVEYYKNKKTNTR